MEAKTRNLREEDYWGGFVIDEMKIQVQYQSCTIFFMMALPRRQTSICKTCLFFSFLNNTRKINILWITSADLLIIVITLQ